MGKSNCDVIYGKNKTQLQILLTVSHKKLTRRYLWKNQNLITLDLN